MAKKMVQQLDGEAMVRVAKETRRLMIERHGESAEKWLDSNAPFVLSLSHCTWIATRKELEDG